MARVAFHQTNAGIGQSISYGSRYRTLCDEPYDQGRLDARLGLRPNPWTVYNGTRYTFDGRDLDEYELGYMSIKTDYVPQ